MEFRDCVKKEWQRWAELKAECEKELEHLPKGKMTSAKINGKLYYYQKQGNRKIYLGKQANESVQELQKRFFLEQVVVELGKNISLIEDFLSTYKELDILALKAGLPRAYQSVDVKNIGCLGRMEEEAFLQFNRSYERCQNHPEHLRHVTANGEKVRSKSEVLLANMMYERGIPYHYEEKLVLPEREVYPDFTIFVRSERRVKYLEHCGMIYNDDYFQTFAWKLKTYLSNGFIPWRDVFFTFDEQDGSIDTFTISHLLESYFL